MNFDVAVSDVYEPVSLELLHRILAEPLIRSLHPSVSAWSSGRELSVVEDPDDGAAVVIGGGADRLPLSSGPSAMLTIHVPDLRGRVVLVADNRDAYEACMMHLDELGHRRVVFLCGDPQLFGNRGRKRDFRETLIRRRTVLTPMFVDVDHTSDAAANALRILRGRGTTAVVCSTDMLASAVIHEACRLGLRVPEDLSVVGYGDSFEAALQSPELTTIRMPFARVSKAVAQILYEYSVSRSVDVDRLSFRSEFIIRQSTGLCPEDVGENL
ncbi:LacI family DNA-binding transcriptional regulator [Bifidobacterium mongoliense]|uniref:LacI family transcriptional regulator n=1 Tax=Bifidobacterium mongoliense DSM 21395 TaxID=1437603 RepID=A0A087C7M0_9BIFI|nr:LacI family DNA-binding transcriptional regulator [Bifidobacterium mongoliense]KFI79270.1 LacI family transcriptional regulator [Bifidobacterium mongoliense DSM 21395]